MRVLDIFSGIGGFSLGLQKAGMQTVAFAECEDHCKLVLAKHWPSVPIYNDVRTINATQLRLDGTEFDLICGGFPCQDISIAGKNAGIEHGERSGLWREFARIISDCRPKYALIENVSALLSRGLNVVLKDLADLGYDATWATLDSQFFGLPQRRRRVYILAVRDGIPESADIFHFDRRDSGKHRSEVADFQRIRPWNFTQGEGVGHSFAFYTRQRSDQFACAGLSSTLAKRDYKSFTDLVVDAHGIRRVTPDERLALQGFPRTFFDGLDLSDKQRFSMNGMSVNVVAWLGHRIMEFDNSARA